MENRALEKQMKEEQKFFGITPGFKLMTPGAFGGIDQSSSRMMIEDTQSFWMENFIKTGNGALRTLWDKGEPIYVATGTATIVYFYFFNIGAANYAAVFLSDGTAVQVDTDTLVVTQMSSMTNTFYDLAISKQLPACGQWGTQYLLIANNITTNSYWAWDGKLLYGAGTIAPQVTVTNSGTGYGKAPTVVSYGGSGTGATFAAMVANGSVVSVQVINPGTGYLPTDVVQLAFGSVVGVGSTAQLVATLNGGTVQSVSVVSPGTGFTPGSYNLVFAGGGGTGATGNYTVDASGGVIATNITANGSGYSSNPTVSFPNGGGHGAVGLALLAGGGVASVTILDGGNGYTAAPTITFTDGGGSGAMATATITGGVITAVSVTAGGSGYTTVPGVVLSGAGIPNIAAATLTLMPYGVSGSSIETYQQRVWLPYPKQTGNLVNGGTFTVSSPGSFSDFSTANGGIIFENSDSFLRAQYTNIRQSNGYLYPLADSSVSVISNVQTVGSPPVTTFNYQNTDPQIGTSWRDSVQAFSRTILFANQFGVFGLYGGAVTKISTNVDNLFTAATVDGVYRGAFNPSSAVANIYSKKIFLLLFSTVDPTTQQTRTVMLSWDEKDFAIASQTADLIFIGTQEINSNLTSFGTDGKSLFPLFDTPSASLTKKLSTKLYGSDNPLVQKEAMGVYFQVQDKTGTGVSMTTVDIDAEHGSYPIPSIASFPPNSRAPYYPIVSMGSGDVSGVNLGVTITSNSLDFVLNSIGLGAIEVSSIAMSSTPIEGDIETQ